MRGWATEMEEVEEASPSSSSCSSKTKMGMSKKNFLNFANILYIGLEIRYLYGNNMEKGLLE
jgi:hypothetical protein